MPKEKTVMEATYTEEAALFEHDEPKPRIRRRLTLSPDTIARVEGYSRQSHLSPDEVIQVALDVAILADESTVLDVADRVIRSRARFLAESVGAAFK